MAAEADPGSSENTQIFSLPDVYTAGIRVYDVGQGNGVGLLTPYGVGNFRVYAFVDIGGSSSHAHTSETQPAWWVDLQAVAATSPPVVLTHWHTDHYRFFSHSDVLPYVGNILVPNQLLSSTIKSKVSDPAGLGGKIVMWPDDNPGIEWHYEDRVAQQYSIVSIRPSLRYGTDPMLRNTTGLTVAIATTYRHRAASAYLSWIQLPGDNSLHLTPQFRDDTLRAATGALTAFHHGTRKEWNEGPGNHDDSVWLVKNPLHDQHPVVYSWKPGNRYGHPTAYAKEKYNIDGHWRELNTPGLNGGYYDLFPDHVRSVVSTLGADATVDVDDETGEGDDPDTAMTA